MSPTPDRRRQGPRPEPPLSKGGLERSALWHLQRRAMTERELRTALGKKVARAARAHGPCDEASAWVDALVVRLKDNLLLDDVRVASARVASDVAHGRSRRMVAQRLKQKGIASELIVDATAGVDDDHAADAFVRRRRLHEKDRQKALAALARQGFPFDVARRALDRAGT
jgi:regulatory protein